MSTTDEHLDLTELRNGPRKGWFVKEADDMPQHKKYPADSGWYGPYTMSAPKKHPIWG